MSESRTGNFNGSSHETESYAFEKSRYVTRISSRWRFRPACSSTSPSPKHWTTDARNTAYGLREAIVEPKRIYPIIPPAWLISNLPRRCVRWQGAAKKRLIGALSCSLMACIIFDAQHAWTDVFLPIPHYSLYLFFWSFSRPNSSPYIRSDNKEPFLSNTKRERRQSQLAIMQISLLATFLFLTAAVSGAAIPAPEMSLDKR